MKNIIMILSIVLVLFSISNGATNYNNIEYKTIYEKTFVLDTSEVDTVITEPFGLYSDSLTFVVEIVSADSLTKYRNGDSTAVNVRLRYLTPYGTQDSTLYANLPVAVDKGAGAGSVVYGNRIPLTSAKKAGKGRLEINIGHTYSTPQTVRIRIYAIKEWGN